MSALDLARLEGLAQVMAAERDAGPLHDDAVQEGLVAAWTAAQRHPDKPPAYYHRACQYGVVSVLRGRPMTGTEGRQGWQDAHDHAAPLTTTTPEGEEHTHDQADPAAQAALEAIEHRDPTLHAALAALPDQDRHLVWLRYWLGLGFTECAQHLQRPAGTLSRRWSQTVRPALADALTAA